MTTPTEFTRDITVNSVLHDQRRSAADMADALQKPDLQAAVRCGLLTPYLIRPRASDCQPRPGHAPQLMRALRELLTAPWDDLHAAAGGDYVALYVRLGPAMSSAMIARRGEHYELNSHGDFSATHILALKRAQMALRATL